MSWQSKVWDVTAASTTSAQHRRSIETCAQYPRMWLAAVRSDGFSSRRLLSGYIRSQRFMAGELSGRGGRYEDWRCCRLQVVILIWHWLPSLFKPVTDSLTACCGTRMPNDLRFGRYALHAPLVTLNGRIVDECRISNSFQHGHTHGSDR